MLDKFRETAITWDKANRKVYEPLRVSAGDNKGRKLSVQVVNDGVIENLSGASLSFFWETKDKVHKGLDAFTAVDASKGEFEIYYTTGMLSNEGTLNANLVLVDASGRIVSEPFTITIFKGIDDDAIQSSDSFTALTEALIDVSNLEQNYAPRLNDLTAQLQQTERFIISSNFNSLDDAVAELNSSESENTTLLIDEDYTVSDTFTITKPYTNIRSINNSVITRTDTQKSVFSFLANNCSLSDTVIKSPTGWYGHNSKWQNNEAVVHISGHYFRAINNTIENIYRVGFGVRKANNILFSGNHIIGNYPASQWTGVESVNHGITLDGGKFTIITGNTIEHCVNDIFIGRYEGDYTVGVIINDNILNYTFGHAIYCGNDNEHTTITGNTIYNSKGAIACTGDGHSVTGNTILFDEKASLATSGAHISLRDSQNAVVSGNTIKTINTVGPAGASIALQSKDKGLLKNNIITNNTIEQANFGPAIRVIPQNVEDFIIGNVIDGNMITGKCGENQGMITLAGSTVNRADYNKIRNNTIIVNGTNASGWGIYTPYQNHLLIENNDMRILFNSDFERNMQFVRFDNVVGSIIRDNVLYIPTGYGLLLTVFMMNATASSQNSYVGNVAQNEAGVALTGFNLNDYATVLLKDNRVGPEKLYGTITTATQSTTIQNKNMTTHSVVVLTPTNSNASKLGYYVTVSNGSFTVITESVPAGECTYNYMIM